MSDLVIPEGYAFAGVHAGIKSDAGRKDLALFVSDRPASAVGMYTTNRVCAAPVQLCRRRTPGTGIRGVVANSGNANACTGEEGLRNAERMTALAAAAVGAPAEGFLVCSTGVIGRPLPMPVFPSGISAARAALGRDRAALEAAASAILTTDTRIKLASRRATGKGGEFSVLGVAKGAAMIGPSMATMLAFLFADAEAAPELLDRALRPAVDASFHCISVEGHTSTNDTVLLLANGAAGVAAEADSLRSAVREVCMELAQAIVRDAEGGTKFCTIDVTGAGCDGDAWKIAKAVADSALVKSALFGNDPNWGRICSAAGYAGVPFAESDLSLKVNGALLYDRGAPTPFDKAAEAARLAASRDVHIELTLTLGDGCCRFWTSDLSYDYVRLNAEYTT